VYLKGVEVNVMENDELNETIKAAKQGLGWAQYVLGKKGQCRKKSLSPQYSPFNEHRIDRVIPPKIN
jgi:hypothetical protein